MLTSTAAREAAAAKAMAPEDLDDTNSMGKVLDRLFQHTFAAAKAIRNSSGINDRPVSVAYTAVVLARQIFSDLSSQTVVLVGAGEMVQLCARSGSIVVPSMDARNSREFMLFMTQIAAF